MKVFMDRFCGGEDIKDTRIAMIDGFHTGIINEGPDRNIRRILRISWHTDVVRSARPPLSLSGLLLSVFNVAAGGGTTALAAASAAAFC